MTRRRKPTKNLPEIPRYRHVPTHTKVLTALLRRYLKHKRIFLSPIPVAARSKAWVCGRSFAGIAGSNLAGGMDVFRLSVLCLVRYRSLGRPDPSSRGIRVCVCVCVCVSECDPVQQ